MLVKTVGQLVLEPIDLRGQLDSDGDEGGDGRAHGVGNNGRCLEMFGPQGSLDLDSPLVAAPLPATTPQRRSDLRS